MTPAASFARFLPLSVLFVLAGTLPGLAFDSETVVLDSLPLIVDSVFPAQGLVRRQARFWEEIYLRTGGDEGWLHDPLYPELAFRKVPAPQSGGQRAVNAATRSLQAELRAAAGSDSSAWTPEQRRLRSLIPPDWDSTAVELCAQRVRFQRGMRDHFLQGLERSYRYLPAIESVFAAAGVPARLRYLPHVESSFHPHAYSKVGAAGMWQFMKATGRKFMKVGYYVDERRDPLLSTAAAAKMLMRCHEILGNWPLAVMAYNHGPDGVAKAVAVTGSADIEKVLQSYYSNTFGFASRNFYAEFLAASTLAVLADSLFPHLDKWEPLRFRTLPLARAASARSVAEWSGLTLAELEEYNLALRPAVFRGQASLPKGYPLRLPLATDTTLLSTRLASAPVDKTETKVAMAPPKPAVPEPTVPTKRGTAIRAAAPSAPAHEVVDSSFALQLSDWESVAHPWDRFRPEVYNLEHRYENGVLTVKVGPEETMSHFSDWSGKRADEIRGENTGLRGRSGFRMGRAVNLRLDSSAAAAFLRRREEYFRGMEEDFYARYHVETLEPLVVAKGANVWNLAQEREVPYWLFLKHNPGRKLEALMPGDTLNLPVVEEGWRRWGFTRYAGTEEYLKGVGRFLRGEAAP